MRRTLALLSRRADAVVFDLGGVVLQSPKVLCMRYAANNGGSNC